MKDKIVLVDDNTTILKYFELLYKDEPYEILTYDNPLNALKKIKMTKPAVVISDQRMPDMEGKTFLQKVREILPDTVQIIMSGYMDNKDMIPAIQKGDLFLFIRKPVDVQELTMTINSAVKYYRLILENKKLIQLMEKQHQKLSTVDEKLKKQVQKQTEQLKLNEKQLKKALKKLRGMLGATIQAVQLTVETRDPYTAGHQRRVANLARAIATEMGLSIDKIEGIRLAGAIHDLGKIYEPEQILNKPGRLTDIEYDIIKIHPKAGYELLKNIKFSWPVPSIVLQHHERLDGSGYPQGLSGNKILLESRIMAVTDVVEAMASPRPYRKALGIKNALEEIKKFKGVLFDPEVAEACLRLFREKHFNLY